MNENIEHKMTSLIVVNSVVGNLPATTAWTQVKGVSGEAEALRANCVKRNLFCPDIVRGILVKKGAVGGKG